MQDWDWHGGNLCILKLALVEDGWHLWFGDLHFDHLKRFDWCWFHLDFPHPVASIIWGNKYGKGTTRMGYDAYDPWRWHVNKVQSWNAWPKFTKVHGSCGLCFHPFKPHPSNFTNHKLRPPPVWSISGQEAFETWTHHPFLLLFGCRGVHLRGEMEVFGPWRWIKNLSDLRWTSINLSYSTCETSLW